MLTIFMYKKAERSKLLNYLVGDRQSLTANRQILTENRQKTLAGLAAFCHGLCRVQTKLRAEHGRKQAESKSGGHSYQAGISDLRPKPERATGRRPAGAHEAG
jgi:hypothetical protein